MGDLAKLAGIAPSVLHYYETQGLIAARRTSGNQRRYDASVLRRVRIIRMAHGVGIPLAEVKGALSILPVDRAPVDKDWRRVALHWEPRIQARIDQLAALRDDPERCIDKWLRAAEGGLLSTLIGAECRYK